MENLYKRVILKLSGEMLKSGEAPFDHDKFDAAAKMLLGVKNTGAETCVVIGGGNVWRGRRGPASRMGAVAADQMGMLATLQNCLCMSDALSRLGERAHIMSAVDIPRFAETYNTAAANDYLRAGRILLFACGLGNPYFSTDSAVALRAVELNCDVILMAKSVDGVYDSDPDENPDAVFIPDVTYKEAAQRNLRVVDQTALSILMENKFPMVRLFSLKKPDNILKVLEGDTMGSFMHP